MVSSGPNRVMRGLLAASVLGLVGTMAVGASGGQSATVRQSGSSSTRTSKPQPWRLRGARTVALVRSVIASRVVYFNGGGRVEADATGVTSSVADNVNFDWVGPYLVLATEFELQVPA